MTQKELYEKRANFIKKHFPYSMSYWKDFNYGILGNILSRRRAGRGDNNSVNDCIIMADTETSKKSLTEQGHNHIVAWTISIRAFNLNICTLWGHSPISFCDCLELIMEHMEGQETICYFHNLSYDEVFLEQFLIRKFGEPVKQLNTKPHYPIMIQYQNGLILKDSLILAQRKLEKWAIDLDVEHKKAVGFWDYDKIRSQHEEFTPEELKYIENDTLSGVECLQAMKDTLGKGIWSMPYTATGVPREEVRKRAKEVGWRKDFLRLVATYEQYIKLTKVFHGGYTHGNRWFIDTFISEDLEEFGTVKCFDFASSYPFVMLSSKVPMERFYERENCSPEYIVEMSESYAYMFKFIAMDIELKDRLFPMPALQHSKCTNAINPIIDNGRIIKADYVEIYITEMDMKVIYETYEWSKGLCVEVEAAKKDYLPRWFTDYVFEKFGDKCKLKGGDKVLYAISKSTVNALFGLTCQHSIRENYMQDFETGEYYVEEIDPEETYDKFVKNRNSVLPYQWGVWITANAFYNLFQLGKCCDTWLYSDTDSCYGIGWHEEKIKAYNEGCKEKLKKNNYGPVVVNGKEFWLGVAEHSGLEDEYSEFKVMGAKRYAGRCKADNEIHITVAGVPKRAAASLHNDLNNFKPSFIFDGKTSGKLLHTYYYTDIYTDENGNVTGNSIDLSPCDYLLDSVPIVDFDKLFYEEVEVQVYE